MSGADVETDGQINALLVSPDIPETHRPSIESLYRLWLRTRDRSPGRRIPAWSDVDVIDFGPWMGRLQVLEVVNGGTDFKFRVHGATFREWVHEDLTGTFVSELDARYGSTLVERYRAAFVQASPSLTVSEPLVQRPFLTYTRLVLPFGADGQTPDRFLVAAFAEFED